MKDGDEEAMSMVQTQSIPVNILLKSLQFRPSLGTQLRLTSSSSRSRSQWIPAHHSIEVNNLNPFHNLIPPLTPSFHLVITLDAEIEGIPMPLVVAVTLLYSEEEMSVVVLLSSSSAARLVTLISFDDPLL